MHRNTGKIKQKEGIFRSQRFNHLRWLNNKKIRKGENE